MLTVSRKRDQMCTYVISVDGWLPSHQHCVRLQCERLMMHRRCTPCKDVPFRPTSLRRQQNYIVHRDRQPASKVQTPGTVSTISRLTVHGLETATQVLLLAVLRRMARCITS
jgi:hypothetical protein